MRIFTRRMAEELAVAHMQSTGFADAHLMQDDHPHGFDVVAYEAAARVGFGADLVDEPDVQRFRGTAHGVKHARFYSQAGFTASAAAFAGQAEVSLFTWDEKLVVTEVTIARQESDFSSVYERGRALQARFAPMQASISAVRSTIELLQQSLITLRDGGSVDGATLAPAKAAEMHGTKVLSAAREFVALNLTISRTLEEAQADLVSEIAESQKAGNAARAGAAMTRMEERASAILEVYWDESRPYAELVDEAARAFGLIGSN